MRTYTINLTEEQLAILRRELRDMKCHKLSRASTLRQKKILFTQVENLKSEAAEIDTLRDHITDQICRQEMQKK
jgi:hypothetical protein